MKFLRQFRQSKKHRPSAFSLLDIGRDTVKAVVVLMIPEHLEPQIVGHGLAETGDHDISGGRLEADAVIGPVNTALTQAEDSTEGFIGQKIVPDDIIFALAGRATAGKLFTVRQSRPNSAEPISARELDNLRARAERLVRQGLADLPVEGGQWRPLAVSDAGIYLDGRFALGGVGLTGQNISFSVFGVAGQAGALRALEVLANRLDLEIITIVAASQALATISPHPGAVILDTGLSGTDVCLIRNNSLVASGWIPFGGKFFTLSVAQAMGITLVEARKLKHGLTETTLPEDVADQVDASLEGPRQRWYQAVMELLFQLSLQSDFQDDALSKPLPDKILLTGGGNLLPGLENLLRSDPRPFSRAPEVARLSLPTSLGFKDLTDGLDQNLFSLTLSLISGLPG